MKDYLKKIQHTQRDQLLQTFMSAAIQLYCKLNINAL